MSLRFDCGTVSMMKELIEEVNPRLPLMIEEIEWNRINFNMNGPNWWFNTLSAWRVCTPQEVCFACYDQNIDDKLQLLKGLKIVRVSCQSELIKIDPLFYLSNGLIMEIFSSDTYEPWTFRVDGLPVYSGTCVSS